METTVWVYNLCRTVRVSEPTTTPQHTCQYDVDGVIWITADNGMLYSKSFIHPRDYTFLGRTTSNLDGIFIPWSEAGDNKCFLRQGKSKGDKNGNNSMVVS